jgi:hypothetical protein
MKFLFVIAMVLMQSVDAMAQNKTSMELMTIQKQMVEYIAAVDAGDFKKAEKFMDKEFRVVLNNYNNSGTVASIGREQYLAMMEAGKVGGNKRILSFLLIDVQENAALVKVKLEGEKDVFVNYYNLVKKNNEWLIVNDQPQITIKSTNKQ